jgi:hypothetical protein
MPSTDNSKGIDGSARLTAGCVFQWVKQLRTLPVLHFNCCLTTEYSETTAHFNGNFDTDNQIYIP